jgi:hypothetical protein
MTVPTKSEQRAAAGGLLFVALTVVWGIIVAHAPDAGTPSAKIDTYFFNRHDRANLVVAGWALAFGGVCLLWFLGALRAWLRRAEGEPSGLSTVAFGAGLVMIATLFAKNAVLTATAAVFDNARFFQLDPDLYKVLYAVASWLFAQELMAGGVMVAAASLLALRTRVLPRGVAWAGYGVAVLCFAAIPLHRISAVALLGWILLVSLLMWSPPGARKPANRASGS